MSEPSTVAVIGAGFSGLLTALRLLLAPEGPQVVLIERGPRFGRGAAYSTANPEHVLNVRATNMSALVEQPAHFTDWLAAQGAPAAERQFVTRDRYGQYLQWLLREARSESASRRLRLEHDGVVGLAREGEGWTVSLAMGRAIRADAVVLALGALPPSTLPGTDPAVLAGERYAADPWARRARPDRGEGEILLLGTGLTAVDVALSIRREQPLARLTALSRHGLRPRAHAEAAALAPGGMVHGSPLHALMEVRRRAAIDWRSAIDGLRPHVQAIWRRWSPAERRRFLRHLFVWWNIVRHRLAPAVAGEIDALVAEGRLSFAAGRIQALAPAPDGIDVTWTPRGATAPLTRRFAEVINCTGPRGDVREAADPLLRGLIEAGLVRPDACLLGLDVDARSRLIGASGEPVESLFAVGPLTRGQFYEITSVPDIRLQAADCADSIVNALALRARAAAAADGEGGASRLADALAGFLAEAIAELDVELGSLKFARRLRNAWELRGRRAALDEVAQWLDERRGRS